MSIMYCCSARTVDLYLNPSEEQSFSFLSPATLDDLVLFYYDSESNRPIDRINVIFGPLYFEVDTRLLCYILLDLRHKAQPSTIVSYEVSTNRADVPPVSGLFDWFPMFHQTVILLFGALGVETQIHIPARQSLGSTEPLHSSGLETLPNCDFVLASETPQADSQLTLDDIRQSLVKTLKLNCFDTIQSVALPYGALSASVFERLSRLPSLHTLSFSNIDNRQLNFSSWSVSPSSFRTLHTIHFYGSLKQVQKIIGACCPESGNTPLRILRITAPRLGDQNDTTHLADVLSKRCKMLQKLTLDVQGMHEREHREWMKISLFEKLGELEEFVVTHPRPLPLTHRVLRKLLQGLRKARWISLNPRPTEDPWQSGQTAHILTLDCLETVVDCCSGSGLVKLGIGLDASRGDVAHGVQWSELEEFECWRLTERGRQVIQRTFPNAILY